MEITMLGYSAFDGIPTMTDSEVMGLYDRMVKDGTNETVFYDGSAYDAESFLSLMKHGLNQLWVVSLDRDVIGVVWLNELQRKSAAFHFCFFSNAWGADTVAIGKKIVMDLLNMKSSSGYVFDILTGMVPVINVRAHKWCRGMGFRVLGTLPKACWIKSLEKSVPGIVYYAERGKYGKGI